jgi:hypothetical protein
MSGFWLFFEWNPDPTTVDNRLILGVLLTPAIEINDEHAKTHCIFRI